MNSSLGWPMSKDSLLRWQKFGFVSTLEAASPKAWTFQRKCRSPPNIGWNQPTSLDYQLPVTPSHLCNNNKSCDMFLMTSNLTPRGPPKPWRLFGVRQVPPITSNEVTISLPMACNCHWGPMPSSFAWESLGTSWEWQLIQWRQKCRWMTFFLDEQLDL